MLIHLKENAYPPKKINILEQKTITISTITNTISSKNISSNNNKNSDILDQKSNTISPINNNESSKNIPSNNNKHSDMLELKSNTIPPINSNKSSKNDHSNINNNLDKHEQNSTIRLITKTHSTSLRDSTIQTTTTLASKQNNISNLTSLILTPNKATISNCSDVSSKLKKNVICVIMILKSPMHCQNKNTESFE